MIAIATAEGKTSMNVAVPANNGFMAVGARPFALEVASKWQTRFYSMLP
jgi:hypothetical protein